MKQEKGLVTLMEVSEVELIYKSKIKASKRPVITSAEDAHRLFKKYWNKNSIELVEEFYAMFLNRSNRVLGIYHLSTGGITGTVADPRLVFMTALKLSAVYIIIAHNHPSSNLKPSRADTELTVKINEGAKFLDIKLLDHLIINEGFCYYSFAEEGVL
ncbi:MAG TPA: JAB domain-containing protein [Puia sp.]|nr:JAB domain-containing protein [Puia sp.]